MDRIKTNLKIRRMNIKKHFFATGNGGNGTQPYAFNSKKGRDNFVAWNLGFDQRRAITRTEARRYGVAATLLINGKMVPNGYGPMMITI